MAMPNTVSSHHTKWQPSHQEDYFYIGWQSRESCAYWRMPYTYLIRPISSKHHLAYSKSIWIKTISSYYKGRLTIMYYFSRILEQSWLYLYHMYCVVHNLSKRNIHAVQYQGQSTYTFLCLAMISNIMFSIRMVLDIVVVLGCRNPFRRCPTSAKLKLNLKLRPTEWSICLKCHSSSGSLTAINTYSGLCVWKEEIRMNIMDKCYIFLQLK